MLVIKTPFGDFGHPNTDVYVKVQYCFEDVFEKNMSFDDVAKWAQNFIRPVAGTLEEAIRWLRLGGV